MTDAERDEVRGMLAAADMSIEHMQAAVNYAHLSMEAGLKARYWLAVATFIVGAIGGASLAAWAL